MPEVYNITQKIQKQEKRKKRRQRKKGDYQNFDSRYISYQGEYIQILLRYPKREDSEEEEEDDDEKQSYLESLLEQFEEQIEEKTRNLEEIILRDTETRAINSVLEEKSRDTKTAYDEYGRFSNIYRKLEKYSSLLERVSSINHIDPETGAQVFYVPSSYLPPDVLGMYVPSAHTIYIANDLAEYERRFVYHHEIAHAKGIRDEGLADSYAAERVGYNLRYAA